MKDEGGKIKRKMKNTGRRASESHADLTGAPKEENQESKNESRLQKTLQR